MVKEQDRSPADQANGPDAQKHAPDGAAVAATKPKRTAGLWWFDAFLYPFLNNFLVFGISVGATYLTARGHLLNQNTLMGKVGKFFHQRGAWLEKQFMNIGMNQKSAEMSKMVFFSFADGTLVAPLIKLFEDRREKIGKWIDVKLGTKPEDESVYKAEPKQTWGSVITGRLATAAVVVPTAVMLSSKVGAKGESLNDKLFYKPGLATGEWIKERPKIAKWFGSLDIKELFRVTYFELFYTSVCTAGLYVISRFIARHTGKKEHPAPQPEALAPVKNDDGTRNPSPISDTPQIKISHTAHSGRVAQSQEQVAALG